MKSKSKLNGIEQVAGCTCQENQTCTESEYIIFFLLYLLVSRIKFIVYSNLNTDNNFKNIGKNICFQNLKQHF